MRQPKAITITMPPILNKSLLPSLEEDRTKEREIPLSTIISMQALPVNTIEDVPERRGGSFLGLSLIHI